MTFTNLAHVSSVVGSGPQPTVSGLLSTKNPPVRFCKCEWNAELLASAWTEVRTLAISFTSS